MLVRQDKHNEILNRMAEDNVDNNEMFAYSKLLLEIMSKKLIVNLNDKLLIKITRIIKNCLPYKTLTASLAIASQILKMKSHAYNLAKEQVINYNNN